MKNYIYFFIQTLALLVVRIPLMVLGLIVVPIGIRYRVEHPGTERPFTKSNGIWRLVTLPKWLWLWSNDRDGALGDKRGWWHANAVFKGGAYAVKNMFWWLAVRNPTNNLRFVKGISCNVSQSPVTKLAGQDVVDDEFGMEGFQWLKAEGPIFNYYHLYYVSKWQVLGKNLIVRIGHKIKLSHNDIDWTKPKYQKGQEDYTKRWKGFTVRCWFFSL